MILVSGNIRFMGIFAGFLLAGASNESGAIFGDLSGYTSSESSQIMPATLYGDMLPLVGQ